MEGSESEAVFESMNLKPQLFFNEILNRVDDLVDEAFTLLHQQASTFLKTDDTSRAQDLSNGLGRIRNLIMSNLYNRLEMWEKYCLRHCFDVPPGFSLPKDDALTGEELLGLNTLGDSELDQQLDYLRNKLTLVGQEAAALKREITALEKHSELVYDSEAYLDEVLQLHEKNFMNETFQELKNTAKVFRAKMEKLKARRMEETQCGRSVRKRLLNEHMFKAPFSLGLFDAKLDDLQQFLDDMKSA